MWINTVNCYIIFYSYLWVVSWARGMRFLPSIWGDRKWAWHACHLLWLGVKFKFKYLRVMGAEEIIFEKVRFLPQKETSIFFGDGGSNISRVGYQKGGSPLWKSLFLKHILPMPFISGLASFWFLAQNCIDCQMSIGRKSTRKGSKRKTVPNTKIQKKNHVTSALLIADPRYVG